MHDEQLVRPQRFDPESPTCIPCNVEEEELSVELHLFPDQEQDDEDHQVPAALIEEGRMHLYVVDPVDRLKVCPHFLGDLVLTHSRDRKLHRKEIVRVFPEGLAVKKVPPSADDLPDRDAHRDRVENEADGNLLDLRHDKNRQRTGDDAAVDRKSALPDVENGHQVVLIGIPGKYNIVDACSDDADEHADEDDVDIIIRLLAGLLCAPHCDPKTDQHADRDHDPVVGDRKIPY